MASSEVFRKCMLCCGVGRRRSEASENTDKASEQEYANADSVENDMQPSEYYNVNEVHNMFHSRDPCVDLYAEVSREEHHVADSGPIYAEPAVAVRLNLKTNKKPPKATPRSLSVREKHDKVRGAQTFGADGTLYMDVRRTLPKDMSSHTHKPMFKKSEYAAIDHTLKQVPPPPKLNFSISH